MEDKTLIKIDSKRLISPEDLKRASRESQLNIMRAWFFYNYEQLTSEHIHDRYLKIVNPENELKKKFCKVINTKFINLVSNELNKNYDGWCAKMHLVEVVGFDLAASQISKKSYNEFINSTDLIKKILKICNKNSKLEQTLNRLLYANVITALEVYFKEIVYETLDNNDYFLYMLIHSIKEKDKNYKGNKSIEEILDHKSWDEFEAHKKNILNSLAERTWHTEGTFDLFSSIFFKIPFYRKLEKPIRNRNDIIHRNGKKKMEQYY